ncbi:hypothetical protein VCHC50A2_3904B, partial [Vibrio cholerae HC-50A2]
PFPIPFTYGLANPFSNGCKRLELSSTEHFNGAPNFALSQ